MSRKRACTPVAERFWGYVDKTEGCWLWTRRTDKDGYGRFTLRRGTTVKAHRLAWELMNGQPVPPKMMILHKCDNPRCVNPEHLYAGTQQQNEQDKTSRGRHRNRYTPEGKHGLDAASVRSIRQDQRDNHLLAAEYGVSESTIRFAKTGKTWSNII